MQDVRPWSQKGSRETHHEHHETQNPQCGGTRPECPFHRLVVIAPIRPRHGVLHPHAEAEVNEV